ncbi:terminase small subunit [Nonomuraea dietziae]|uniref:terminase small subunit n=1 Tax=Nonomuraea dietziae TaxID=65515 RepID=UPI003F4D3B5B
MSQAHPPEEIEKAIDRAEELAELRWDLAGDEGALRRLRALESMCEVTKTVGWFGPQLQGVLRDLGGTPAARKAMKTDKPIGGRLVQLRAATGKRPRNWPWRGCWSRPVAKVPPAAGDAGPGPVGRRDRIDHPIRGVGNVTGAGMLSPLSALAGRSLSRTPLHRR